MKSFKTAIKVEDWGLVMLIIYVEMMLLDDHRR